MYIKERLSAEDGSVIYTVTPALPKMESSNPNPVLPQQVLFVDIKCQMMITGLAEDSHTG